MIKFLDLRTINRSFEPELTQAATRVIDSGWYLPGSEVREFENEYSKSVGSKHCIGVANGLDALRLILKAYIEMGVMQEGDKEFLLNPSDINVAEIIGLIKFEKSYTSTDNEKLCLN